jgi:hypothetical protein
MKSFCQYYSWDSIWGHELLNVFQHDYDITDVTSQRSITSLIPGITLTQVRQLRQNKKYFGV